MSARYDIRRLDQIIGHIGPFIEKRRKELHLSLQEVADRACTSKSHIWELEQGRSKNPTIGMALMLCEALQCSLNSLLGIGVSQPNFSDDELALIAAHRSIFERNQKAA